MKSNGIRAIVAIFIISAFLFVSCASTGQAKTGRVDYSNPENWAYYAVGDGRAADIFIVAPTVDMKSEYNMALDEKNLFRMKRALNMQKGIYEDELRMYSPYYEQMSFKGYALPSAEQEPFLKMAYEEVSEAFRYYLENENNGRPIVLFGYSQGADHVYRLLKDFFGDEKLYSQLVAAYAIGWGCSIDEAERYAQIVPAKGETDIGCVISYEAEAPFVEGSFIAPKDERHFVINPLNWVTDETPADKALNKGSVFMSNDLTATEVQNLCGAYLDNTRGVLKVTDVDPEQYPAGFDIFPKGSYHLYDLYFFWNNLKENVSDRLNAYMSNRV